MVENWEQYIQVTVGTGQDNWTRGHVKKVEGRLGLKSPRVIFGG